MATDKSSKGSAGTPKGGGAATVDKKFGPPHLITVENLIVHKLEDAEALFRKADKVCQALINSELREGEFVQVVRPGRYNLYFPKLRRDAGPLRCAVLATQLYNAVRELNPAAQRLDEPEKNAPPPPLHKAAAKTNRSIAPASARGPTAAERAEAAEHRKMASEAVAAMTRSGSALVEELIGSPVGRLLEQELDLAQVPIWNVKTRLIVGYDCTPFRNGAPLVDSDPIFREAGLDSRDARALIDIILYERVCRRLQESLSSGFAGLIICPVHASTLEGTKYVGAFIGTGTHLPDDARHSLVFLIKGFAIPTSRIKVQEVAGYLRSRCRSLRAEVPLEIEKISPAFKEFGFHGLGVDISGSTMNDKQLLKYFDIFVANCEKAKLDCAILGLESQGLTIAALAAGFSYLAGSAIIRPPGQRGIVANFDIDELFL